MSNLVAIEFPDEHTAFAVRAELAKMQKEYLIDMKDFSRDFTPGASALFVLFREATGDKVLERLQDFKGKILKTSLSIDDEKRLKEVLEVNG